MRVMPALAGIEETMTLNYAVDRLYQTGWLAGQGTLLERLPNGLRYPTVSAVEQIFLDAGLKLSIKPHLMFGCCRAEWSSSATGDGLSRNCRRIERSRGSGLRAGESCASSSLRLRVSLNDLQLAGSYRSNPGSSSQSRSGQKQSYRMPFWDDDVQIVRGINGVLRFNQAAIHSR